MKKYEFVLGRSRLCLRTNLVIFQLSWMYLALAQISR